MLDITTALATVIAAGCIIIALAILTLMLLEYWGRRCWTCRNYVHKHRWCNLHVARMHRRNTCVSHKLLEPRRRKREAK